MNTLTTNIIRNVYNIGSNSCSAGTGYCTDGYALYFPCLTEVTKGQEACFDFYVADYAGKNAYDIAFANSTGGLDGNLNGAQLPDPGKELADLRDVDAITLNLIGAFSCPYGSYSYPDNISSLQTEEYPVMYSLDFGERIPCSLSVLMIDTDNPDSDPYRSKDGMFYSGTEVEVEANDTPTHIFLGWSVLDMEEDDGCEEESWEENIISRDNIYRFVITKDTIVLAVYRERKRYTVTVDSSNKSSHFIIDYGHIEYHISNRPDEIFVDSSDYIDGILEGYHMAAKCVPSTSVIGQEISESYRFVEWKDGDVHRCRLFTVGKDTSAFESGDTIRMMAKCDGPYPYSEPADREIFYIDEFDEEGIHINTEFSEICISDYFGDGKYVMHSDNIYHKFIGNDGYLYFRSGMLELSSEGIEDGIKVRFQAKGEGECVMHVTVNGMTADIDLSQDEFRQYEVYFRKCGKSPIWMTSEGECLVDVVDVCKEEIIDKGKARFCIPPEVTENLPSGPLSVNGAVMVNGRSYGLATTPIGSVNKLPKITINF